MADSTTDGRTKVYAVAAIATTGSPTVAELNAGIDLSGLLTPDGLEGFEPDTGDVDNAKLNSTFNSVLPGRVSVSGTLVRLIKQTGTDTVYNTLVYGFSTNIVIRRDVTSTTAWTIGDKVEVWPSACGEVKNLKPAGNEVHKYEIPLKPSAQPNLRATVA